MRWSLWVLWLAVLITGCGQRPDSKIIEGHWVAEAFRVESVSLPIGPDLYITQNQLGLGTGTAPVKLRGIIAEGKEVALQTEVGLNIMFTFENKDRMYFSIPFVGDRIYYNRDTMYAAVSGSAKPRVAEPVQVAVPQSATPANVQLSPPPTPTDMATTAMPLSSAPPASVAPTPTDAVVKQDMNTQVPVPASETQYERALQAMRDGNKDAALRNLSAALAGGFSDWQRIDAEPLFAVLASDVRFQVLRSRWKKG